MPLSPLNVPSFSRIARKSSLSRTNRNSFYIRQTTDHSSREKAQPIEPFSKMRGLKYEGQTISIQPQYNVIVKPLIEEVSINDKKLDTKTSTASTNFKSSLLHADPLETSTINLKNKLSVFSCRGTENKEHFSFLPADLDEVQSLGESSDQESQLPNRQYETPRDPFQETIRK